MLKIQRKFYPIFKQCSFGFRQFTAHVTRLDQSVQRRLLSVPAATFVNGWKRQNLLKLWELNLKIYTGESTSKSQNEWCCSSVAYRQPAWKQTSDKRTTLKRQFTTTQQVQNWAVFCNWCQNWFQPILVFRILPLDYHCTIFPLNLP